ncbi:carboxypeptidase-like regulatory domain-containing protein [Flavobacteriaceae bacterium]|nr:carboxypeptidase-like regulatory domain-containing protein [Flavobacteriaceae bacterium]
MKIKSVFFLLIILLISSALLNAQELTAVLKDSISHKVIPFASIYFNSGSGVVSNEEGHFRLQYDASKEKDSLFISCMGYKTLNIPFSKVKDTVFYLSPKTIELNSIILSNNQLDVKEILKEIQKDIPEKYELGLTKKKLFFRETGAQEFKILDVKIKKTSITEFNQSFWDSTLLKIPRKNSWYFELIGNLNGDYNKKNQKLELLKALELEDKEKTAIFENIEKLFDTILKQNVKSNSFFKVRSGIIGGKVEADEINDTTEDTLTSKQKIQKEKDDFLKWRKRVLSNSIISLFDEEKLDLTILKKASKYKFTQTDFTYLGDTPVYIINFYPDGNADFKGKIYVDADKLALIRIEYKNIQPIRDFSMFGVSFKEDLREVIVQFKKTASEKYSLEYFDFNTSFEGGFDRPLVITEKNKIVKGRNKQNQLKMDLNVVNRNNQRYQLVIFETTPLDIDVFEDFQEKAKILPVNRITYDPNFWEGYMIIEPNASIKEYRVD